MLLYILETHWPGWSDSAASGALKPYGSAQPAPAAWFLSSMVRGLRIARTSSAAGATARITVVVQTGCGYLSGGHPLPLFPLDRVISRLFSILFNSKHD